MSDSLQGWMTKIREERLNEPGTMPPCPFCQRPRVQRSDYVRCNPCGLNWLHGENLSLNPHLSRAPCISTTTIRTAEKPSAPNAERVGE